MKVITFRVIVSQVIEGTQELVIGELVIGEMVIDNDSGWFLFDEQQFQE